MGNIFVRRPIFAMVIAIMIVVLGLIAIRSMPIEQYPDITPPVVEVSAEYLGADALTIEQSVATPLEESVNGRERHDLHAIDQLEQRQHVAAGCRSPSARIPT